MCVLLIFSLLENPCCLEPQVKVYQPGDGKGQPVEDAPATPPAKVKTFELMSLPQKFVKKYQYAAR